MTGGENRSNPAGMVRSAISKSSNVMWFEVWRIVFPYESSRPPTSLADPVWCKNKVCTIREQIQAVVGVDDC